MNEAIQGSKEWLEFRSKSLGSSDAPVVMGVSPYKTAFQLWQEKTGQAENNDEQSFICLKGHETEPRARALFNLKYGYDMKPAVVKHKDYPFLHASLDGYDGKKCLEIKFVGKDNFEEIRDTKTVTQKYYPQVQHQLIVTAAVSNIYCAYNDKYDDIAIVEVFPDIDYIDYMFKKLCAFWDLVQTKTPPPFTTGDYKPIRRAGLKKLVNKWKALTASSFASTSDIINTEQQILEGFDYERMRFDDVRIEKRTGKGYRFFLAKS